MTTHDPQLDQLNRYLDEIDDWNGRTAAGGGSGNHERNVPAPEPSPYHRCRTLDDIRACAHIGDLVWRTMYGGVI